MKTFNTAVVVAAVTLLSLVSASPLNSARDTPSEVDCITAGKYIGIRDNTFYPYCSQLSQACLQYLSQDDFDASKGIWAEAVCVAAATCDGVNGLTTLAKCYDTDIAALDRMPDLDYDVRSSLAFLLCNFHLGNVCGFDYDITLQIYADIVGDCAGQDGECSITQQNYIDFFNDQLSALNTTTQLPEYVLYAVLFSLSHLLVLMYLCYFSDTEVVEKFWQPMLEWANSGDSIPYTNFNDWLHYSETD